MKEVACFFIFSDLKTEQKANFARIFLRLRYITVQLAKYQMKQIIRGIILILFCIPAFYPGVMAQQGWEAGGWAGSAHYFGDLNTNFDLSKPGPAAGLQLRYLFNERLAFKTSLNYAFIHETDEDSTNPFEKSRNLHFRSHIFDFSNQFEFNFMPYVHGTRNYFSPYFLLGLSVFHYNPQSEYQGNWYNLREYGTEGQIVGEEYYSFSAGLIYGAGIKWDINYRLSMNVEVSARLIPTDYLDDVSTVYPNRGEISSLRGEIGLALSNPSTVDGFGEQGTQRGNSKDNDTYVTTGVSFMYFFGQLNCPTIYRY